MNMNRNQMIGLLAAGVAVFALLGIALRRPAAPPPPRRTPVAQTPAPPPPPAPEQARGPEPEPLRPMDRAVMARVEQGMPEPRAEDAIPSQPWRVNLFNDGHVIFAKIDLTRDGHHDEVLEFVRGDAGMTVTRHVLPADSGAETIYNMDGDRWVPR